MDARDALGEPAAYISRSALLHNAAIIRRQIPARTRICAIVKANAYGHGAELVVDALANFATAGATAPAVDAFAVADLDEAAALPAVSQPILVLRPIENCFLGRQRAKIEHAIRRGWWLTLASPLAADDIARIAATAGRPATIQIMLDTGMNRAGVSAAALPNLLQKIRSRPALQLAGIYTHFVNGEDAESALTIDQLATFLDETDPVLAAAETFAGGDNGADNGGDNGGAGSPRILRHAANSGGIFFTSPAHLDLVRPGISLYGIDPTGRPSIDRPLRPALRWMAPLVGIRDVAPGESVGYGQTWKAARPTRVGLVPVGYADGYSRNFSNRGVTLVHGSVAPVIGRVSMDFTTIDLSSITGAAIGDAVTLIDADPLSPASIYKLAEWENTIPYEVLCRIGQRVRRVAVDPSDGREPITAAAADATE
jgi:alanine racemase